MAAGKAEERGVTLGTSFPAGQGAYSTVRDVRQLSSTYPLHPRTCPHRNLSPLPVPVDLCPINFFLFFYLET